MIPPNLKPSACSLLANLLVHSASLGAGDDDAGGTFGLYIENDLFDLERDLIAGTGEHYTSGFTLSWSPRDLEQVQRFALRQSDSPTVQESARRAEE